MIITLYNNININSGEQYLKMVVTVAPPLPVATAYALPPLPILTPNAIKVKTGLGCITWLLVSMFRIMIRL
jgi:hypothetical protein